VSLFKRSLAHTAIINERQRRAIQGQMQDNYLQEYLNCDANCMLTTQRVYINIKYSTCMHRNIYIQQHECG